MPSMFGSLTLWLRASKLCIRPIKLTTKFSCLPFLFFLFMYFLHKMTTISVLIAETIIIMAIIVAKNWAQNKKVIAITFLRSLMMGVCTVCVQYRGTVCFRERERSNRYGEQIVDRDYYSSSPGLSLFAQY